MKKLFTLLCLALVTLLLVSCSMGYNSSSDSSLMKEYGYGGGSTGSTAPMAPQDGGLGYTNEYQDFDEYETADSAYTDSGNGEPVSGISVALQTNVSLAEKIIYSASASVETIHFDDSLSELDNMITQFDAFVESSYVSGADYASKYYGYNAYRTANYVIRVPRENYSALTNSLSALGHVTSLSTDATNVTEQYTDVQSRLAVYRTEESRLLAMLEKCDTVADMITIESTLSNVRYEIESLTSRLKNLDNQVNYSSVTIHIREVEELTPAAQTHRTYGEQLSDGFRDTLGNIGTFFKNLLKFIVVNSPVLVIFLVIIIAVIVLFRRRSKRSKQAAHTEKAAAPDDAEK